ncbi:phosphatase PAP2 family protein [Spiroplasma cantharicola]|uniref:Phosphatidic acid phosphatase type 2/haloperoxidase domain-containing protein n=1 Tax=Spiroplasma cantharicola TaxID=362837 RepID=A0A0M4JS27_9MOLU|nr:phosphatase PAP2 family protein [Spiroplasma cantharicola]ALD66096.1 hypothetical protein SCANT_v1c01860 [Spiroplasma cantharicola]
MLKKTNFKNKYIVWFSLLIITLVFFILTSFYDLKLSSHIESNLNKTWFTAIFDAYGRVCLFLPIYLFFFIFLLSFFNNLKFSKKQKIIWIAIFNCIYLIIEVTFLYFTKHFILQKNEFHISKFIFSIFFTFSLVGFIIFINIYLRNLFNNENNDINIYFKKALKASIFIILLFISIQLLKIIFGRNRPEDVIVQKENFQWLFQINFSKVRGSSFPSGHTAAAGAMLSFIYFLEGKKIWKKIIIIFIWVFIILTAISRILMSKHFLTDVSFSILIVILYYSVSQKIVKKIYEGKK